MSLNSIGDLAQGLGMRRQSTVLKQQMERLALEISSGVTSDVTKHLKGNLTHFADVRHKLDMLESYRSSADQGRIETSVMQTALERYQSELERISGSAITFGAPSTTTSFSTFSEDAKGTMATLLSVLNTSVAGRSLFAGDEVDTLAVARQDDVLAALSAAVAGATSAADITTAMDTFFDTPGGDFETLVYQGGVSARSPYPLGDGESVSLDLKADDTSFRETLKQVAIAIVADDPGVTLSNADKYQLAFQVGENLISGQNRITKIRADLGFAESRIDRATTRITAEMSALNIVQSELTAIDPFQAATELETVQVRLETLYTLTSRMSRLNLVNFLS